MKARFLGIAGMVLAAAAVHSAAGRAGAQCEPGPTRGVTCVAFMPDGTTIAAAGFDKPVSLTITLWNRATGKGRRTLAGPKSTIFSGVAFSGDVRLLAAGKYPGEHEGPYVHTVTVWEVETGRELHAMRGHEQDIEGMAFSPGGTILASGSQDKTLRLWNVATGRPIRILNDEVGMIGEIAFSPDGRLIASGSNTYPPGDSRDPADETDTIKVWEAGTGKLLSTSPRQKNWVSYLAFSPDGKLLASVDWDNTITMWDAGSGKIVRVIAGAADAAPAISVGPIAFSPDGRTLASGSEGNTIRLYEVATGKLLLTLAGHTDAVTSIAFSRDGRTLVSGSDDNTVKLWDMAKGKEVQSFGVPNPPDASN